MSGSRTGFLARLRDPRILLGFGISALALWFVLRGVDFRQLRDDLSRANLLWLLLPSIPAHIGGLYMRAVRWRHLTDAVQSIDRGPLFRAVGVGFMANNIFPLRIGEFVRAWYLSKETGAPSAALFGTVILERLLDLTVVVALAAVVIGLGGAEAAGMEATTVLPALIGVASVPLAFVVSLRMAPDWIIGVGTRITGFVLPERLNASLEELLRSIAKGLGSLRGGRHLWWIAFHSIVIWVVLSPIPFLAGLWALDVDIGSPARTAMSAYTALVWVGAAIALPSAPGFFGPFHAACWLALRPFGVPKELAVAVGTLIHAVFWLTMTSFGLLVLRFRNTSLLEIEEAASDSQ